MCFVIMWHFIVSRHSQKWALAGDLHLLHSTLAPLQFMWNVVNKAEHWVLSDINISISDIFCFVSMVRGEVPAWIKYINVKSWQFRILFLDNFNFVVGGESSEKWEVVLCCCGAWDGGQGGVTSHWSLRQQWTCPILTSSMIHNECLYTSHRPFSGDIETL